MRSISLVDKLEVEFEGNVMQNAIKFGDIDNDGNNELIAGNVYGYLAVFKGRQSKPWRYAYNLGLISCILIGDIFNIGKNHLLVFIDDGHCHIFQFDSPTPDGTSEDGAAAAEEDVAAVVIEPVYSQCLPANIKDVLLADIDGDGKVELVCALTDRIVRMYKWQVDATAEVAAAQDDGAQAGVGTEDETQQQPPSSTHLPQQPPGVAGHLMAVNKWELSRQIGNVSTNIHSAAGEMAYLLISQPGGTYISLQHSSSSATDREDMTATDSDHNVLQNHPLGSTQARNKNITTEIVGRVCCSSNAAASESTSDYKLALCTADGTISLVDGDHIIWSFQVDHQLFGVTKLDVTGDGRDEVIVSSGCGTTYIVDCNMNAVRFQLGEDIRTFHAGLFCAGASPTDGNQAAFTYVTYNNQIVTYYNIRNVSMKIVSLREEVSEDMSKLVSQIQGESSSNQITASEIYEFCLYGLPNILTDKGKVKGAHKS